MSFRQNYPPPPPPITNIDYNFEPLEPIPPPEYPLPPPPPSGLPFTTQFPSPPYSEYPLPPPPPSGLPFTTQFPPPPYSEYPLPPPPPSGLPFTTQFPPPPSFFLTKKMTHPHYFINLIYQMEYPDIYNLCSTNKEISNLCLNNSVIRKHIIEKRKQYARKYANDFLKRLFNSRDAFIKAIRTGNLMLINELYKMGYDPSTGYKITGSFKPKTNKPLIEAIKLGNLNVINQLLKYKEVNPSDFISNRIDLYGGTLSPLNVAIETGNMIIIKRLLEDPRVDPSDYRNDISAYEYAEYMNRYDILDLLQNY